MSIPARSAAFTLIELLVVIFIIGVLVAISLPIFQKVQESGRIAKCSSNLRQIGAGILAFAGDNNGLCPLAGAEVPYHGKDGTSGLPGWSEQLEPYAGTDRAIYVCPSSSILIPANKQYAYFMGAHAAYVANNSQFAALRLNRISTPSKYILAGDITSATTFTAVDADKDDFTKDPIFATTPISFHNGRANIVFADGHIGAFAAFDPNAMNTQYNPQTDGTGYNYGQ